MKKLYFVSLLFLSMMVASEARAQQNFKKIIKFEDLEKYVNKKDDVLYVVNFWATWCGPCVREIPDFMDVNKQFEGRADFKMLLVSLDSKSDLSKELLPFLKEHNIAADVYLLDDNKRMNYWMPKIDKSWSGSIPATVFYRNKKKIQFVENQLYKEELLSIIKEYIQL